jgi:hypothetical protein
MEPDDFDKILLMFNVESKEKERAYKKQVAESKRKK